MSRILHALPEAAVTTLEETGTYRPPSLDADGFVHCSKPGQLVVVADANFAGRDDLRVLVLEEDRIDVPVRYEPDPTSGSAFPHVYGPIDRAYVTDVLPFPRDDTGFRLPEALLAD